MKIHVWRVVPKIWAWHCPVCKKMWRNRQATPLRRPSQRGKYYPMWASELRVPGAWERCVYAAHNHIKRRHGDMLPSTPISELGDLMSSSHYVARLVIERVDFLDVKRNAPLSIPVEDTKRVVTQLTSITVRDDSLTGIITKVPKHLELIDDIDAVDPEKPKGSR